MNFIELFTKLTGYPPFPWQEALYEEWFSLGKIPQSCILPTGLGKTSVIAVWLIALSKFPDKMPKRLVYVVNRRTVVDQTTEEVEKYQRNRVAAGVREFEVSTLRGQFADNGRWCADPSKPAVICGTVDMIGSRLLFSGYGIGRGKRPLHAGFLGQDALLVHDEAHLEPAFQTLIDTIESEQKRERAGKPAAVATTPRDGIDRHSAAEAKCSNSPRKRRSRRRRFPHHPIRRRKGRRLRPFTTSGGEPTRRSRFDCTRSTTRKGISCRQS